MDRDSLCQSAYLGGTKRLRNIFPRWVEVFRHTTSWDSPILLGSLLASTSDKQWLWGQFKTTGTVFLITAMLVCFKMDMAIAGFG
mmetsp:Transcript_25982/g.38190  ORF Transcript_25982/g.38190 Transcript_25982/m.38190 type:complete len:85 (+) Transcript_25982:519-773(+)